MGKGGGGGGGASESSDTLQSIQYAKILDAVCEGEIEGLYKNPADPTDTTGFRSVFFDGVPYENKDGTVNFPRTEIYTTTGTQAQAPLTEFSSGVEGEVAVGVQVTQNTPVTRTINSNNINKVRVNISIPRLTTQDTTTGSLSGSKVQYQISLQSNYGGFVPLSLGLQSHSTTFSNGYFTTVPLSVGIDGIVSVYNYSSTSISASINIEYRLVGGNSWTAIYSNTGLNIPRVVAYIDDDSSTPGTVEIPFKVSNLTEGSYEVRSVVLSGNVTTEITTCTSNTKTSIITLMGKTTSKYNVAYEFALPANSAPYDIKVERITPDAITQAVQNQTVWDSYTEIVTSNLNYPNTALIGIKMDSSQFRTIPQRAYRLKLKKVKVPSNYNPITRNYTGIWDGNLTSTPIWTDNPAWCFYDLITNSRYGLGEFISTTWVDKFALYTVGRYCDAVNDAGTFVGVNNGFGNPEPRFTCNLYLQSQEEAFRVIQNMASIFRAMLYWQEGTLVTVADKPESTWAQFTNADVVDGLFTYQGSANKARHTVALVTWNDMSDGCRQKIEYVEDAEGIYRYGINQTDVIALGCTSRAQAHRLGRWLLYTERLETNVVTFKSGLKGINILPGKIINIIDQHKTGERHAGRIVSSTPTSVTLDAEIVVHIQDDYSVDLELPDGTIVNRPITNLTGNTSVLNWTEPLHTQPSNNAIWMVSELELSPETFRVLSITEEADNLYTISALEHNASKFDFIENNLALTVNPTSIFKTVTSMSQITTPVVSDSVYKLNNNNLATKMHVSWDPVVGA